MNMSTDTIAAMLELLHADPNPPPCIPRLDRPLYGGRNTPKRLEDAKLPMAWIALNGGTGQTGTTDLYRRDYRVHCVGATDEIAMDLDDWVRRVLSPVANKSFDGVRILSVTQISPQNVQMLNTAMPQVTSVFQVLARELNSDSS